jgi:hypothetical protein
MITDRPTIVRRRVFPSSPHLTSGIERTCQRVNPCTAGNPAYRSLMGEEGSAATGSDPRLISSWGQRRRVIMTEIIISEVDFPKGGRIQQTPAIPLGALRPLMSNGIRHSLGRHANGRGVPARDPQVTATDVGQPSHVCAIPSFPATTLMWTRFVDQECFRSRPSGDHYKTDKVT